MGYSVARASAVAGDLGRIQDHLVESYCNLGDGLGEAFDRADARVRAIEGAMHRLGEAPHQGTLCPDLLPGLRRVTKDKAIFYFLVDDTANEVRILSVFFSGQDHLRHILARLRAPI